MLCPQDPKGLYPVGSSVQYSCITGYYLIGESVAECAENQTWRTGAMLCKSMFTLVVLMVKDAAQMTLLT